MNNFSLLHQIVVDKPLGVAQLRKDMEELQKNGVLPADITMYSVHVSSNMEGDMYYDIYPYFANIINVIL